MCWQFVTWPLGGWIPLTCSSRCQPYPGIQCPVNNKCEHQQQQGSTTAPAAALANPKGPCQQEQCAKGQHVHLPGHQTHVNVACWSQATTATNESLASLQSSARDGIVHTTEVKARGCSATRCATLTRPQAFQFTCRPATAPKAKAGRGTDCWLLWVMCQHSHRCHSIEALCRDGSIRSPCGGVARYRW